MDWTAKNVTALIVGAVGARGLRLGGDGLRAKDVGAATAWWSKDT